MIAKHALVSNPDGMKFWTDVVKDIDAMQDAGLDVEVQYRPIVNNHQVLFTAAILGRTK